MNPEEEKESEMKWMYKGLSGHVDREEYLTGRKVDKTFDLIRAEETGKSDFDVDTNIVPQSILSIATTSASVDVASKVKEDPLWLIKQKEIEKKKEILLNPVKMKRLQQMLKIAIEDDSSSSSDDEHRRKRHKKSKKRKKSKKSKQDKHSKDETSRTRSSSSERSPSYRHYRSSRRSRSRERSSERHNKTSSYSSRSDSKGHTRPERYSSRRRSYDRQDSSTNRVSSRQKYPDREDSRSRKLSAEELEKKRQEMMAAAAEREIDRSRRVQDMRQRNEEESRSIKETTGKGHFIRPLLSSVVEQDTLESRVRDHVSRQSKRSMDSGFVKR